MRGNLVIRLFTIKIYAYFTYFEIGFVLRGRGRFGERPQDTDCGKSDPPRDASKFESPNPNQSRNGDAGMLGRRPGGRRDRQGGWCAEHTL